ncbi:MAG: helix-turn-helix transcriptional regulator [Thermoplasmata archaeon]|nr:helix-turn-helix transcriptional regulator [Thermoplasmata archaeon]
MGRRLFFPKTANFTIDPLASSLPPSPVQKKIVEYLKDNGPASRFDIEHALSLKRQTVSYSVRRLEERGLIKCSGNGRKDLCEASEL